MPVTPDGVSILVPIAPAVSHAESSAASGVLLVVHIAFTSATPLSSSLAVICTGSDCTAGLWLFGFSNASFGAVLSMLAIVFVTTVPVWPILSFSLAYIVPFSVIFIGPVYVFQFVPSVLYSRVRPPGQGRPGADPYGYVIVCPVGCGWVYCYASCGCY